MLASSWQLSSWQLSSWQLSSWQLSIPGDGPIEAAFSPSEIQMPPGYVRLTPVPITVSVAGAVQLLSEAIDVSGYDIVDVVVTVVGLTGTSPTATFEIVTGNQKETEVGWVRLMIGTSQTAVGSEKLRGEGPMRYIRWKVPTLGGTGSPTVTFFIDGILRRLG